MDLQQEWQNMNAEFTEKDKMGAIASFNFDDQSKSLISSLLFKLKWKLRWIRIISLPMLIAAFFIKSDLQYLLIAFFITYELCRILGQKELNKIKTTIDFNSSTKQVLTDNLSSIKQILKMENVFGYTFLPLSGPIGLMAYKLYAHKNLAAVIELPNLIWQLLICMLVSLPFIYITQKMNDSIFAMPIKELESKIEQLENE